MSKPSKTYTLEEVASHHTKDDLWTVIDGEVYDVTTFFDEHPGGDIILDAAGIDSTGIFEDVGHSFDARDILKNYHLGKLTKNKQGQNNDKN
eukprot:TRINITY_DN5849_c0_g1_i2.p1 TRINITY_DN5849_c0_g1~~TRINITY_DN5849_c0_g1_i2.p1  ORF type:complete len:106 (+),score=22.62 TRINITY_DN5849_c0_g1_i2:44-319(+)